MKTVLINNIRGEINANTNNILLYFLSALRSNKMNGNYEKNMATKFTTPAIEIYVVSTSFRALFTASTFSKTFETSLSDLKLFPPLSIFQKRGVAAQNVKLVSSFN